MTRPNNWMDESYMNIKEDNRPYMDPYLKDMINKFFITFFYQFIIYKYIFLQNVVTNNQREKMNLLKKLLTIVIGLTFGALIYFAVWSLFVYFGIVS